ncbi:hypothetical protein AAVH_17590 [Aphelenchoides avenae]|nr:hypothetical protein AAVH_17590 [Aphelenchus avenae]
MATRRCTDARCPLWIAGIHLLRTCERFEIKYESDWHLRTIGLKLVELCEKFERGEIAELVKHFKFATQRRIAFPFKQDNKTASEVKVGDYEWNVYRFRNVATGECITACAGYDVYSYSDYSVLHIVKGDAHPDASFVA